MNEMKASPIFCKENRYNTYSFLTLQFSRTMLNEAQKRQLTVDSDSDEEYPSILPKQPVNIIQTDILSKVSSPLPAHPFTNLSNFLVFAYNVG